MLHNTSGAVVKLGKKKCYVAQNQAVSQTWKMKPDSNTHSETVLIIRDIYCPVPETGHDLQISTKSVDLHTVTKFRNTCKIIKIKTSPVYPSKPNMDINNAAVGKAISSKNSLKSRAELQAEGSLQNTVACGQVV